jgi:ribose 5-phosphate isomerase B
MKIAIGNDHAAYEMKAEIVELLNQHDVEVIDMGTNGPESVDYPDFGSKVCNAVTNGEADRGILICGTGIGMSIVANKFKGIRAALCGDCFSARMSREHNDSNVLVMGARIIGSSLADEITKVWLTTGFEGGRHIIRLDKIKGLEKQA